VLLLLGLGQASAAPLRLAVVSDLNGAYGSTRYEPSVDRAIERILELKPDLVISTGDMVAGQRRPHLSRREVEAMWGAFHTRVSDPLEAAGIPLAVTPGNHDGSAYRGFEAERRIYAEQWGAKKPGLNFLDDSHYPFYYAFVAGETLFIALDATIIGRLARDQMRWLRDLLREHGSEYRQRLAFSHLPLWPFAEGREREFIGDPGLEQLFQEANVALYLSGHHHAFYPGHKDGIHYVSQSCLGAGPRKLVGATQRSPRSFTVIEIEDGKFRLSAFRSPDFRRPVDWETLPERIRSQAAELTRADLVDDGLTKLQVEPQPALE
jgi:3',5'-cyclic AMP phosphodiesterase CpdA